MKYTENDLENATLEWFREIGYQIANGIDIDPESENPERKDFSEVILSERLHEAIERINPNIPKQAQEEALKKILNLTHSNNRLIVSNRDFHTMLTDGVDIEYQRADGSTAGDKVWLVDRDNIDTNDWLVVNQFTIIENKNRRPDVVVFINGIPLAIFELKNLADENVGVRDAFNQIETYKNNIPSLFTYNQFVVISDGVVARHGTITSDFDRFMRWRTIDSNKRAPDEIPQLEVLIRGMFTKDRFLDIVLNFITYEQEVRKDAITKKMAAYHQYWATNKAVKNTIKATSLDGDKKCGVVWHTQGSGKSLTMVFYAGKLIQKLNNPTLLVLTDRNDLDDQLYNTFTKSKLLLRQDPSQAKNRNHLKDLLKVGSGGIVFANIQKFFPSFTKNSEGKLEELSDFEMLSDRRNIIVIADEAHRSQYGFKAKFKNQKLKYGFAKYLRDALPNASFIGFTGTPIELTDKNTRAVFGDYADIYDISQAVEDKTTVPIYYEARLAKIGFLEDEKVKVDEEFEDITEGEEEKYKERLKSKWARLEAMVGSEKRIAVIAKDIIEHFENRIAVINGKGMIVTMSRRIAVDLYNEIIKLRPHWHNDDDKKGFAKVVITGSASDPAHFQPHIRNKFSSEELANRMKDPSDGLKLVIVCDMWLTGFDAPSLHTMYFDKPIQGHNLMQAIARVNRVFKDKPGGLIVDYLGIATELKKALLNYTETDRAETAIDQKEAVELMKEKYEVVKAIFHGFNYKKYFDTSEKNKTQIIANAMNFILGLEDGNKRYKKAIMELSSAFSLSIPDDEAIKIRDEVAFFQAVKAGIVKTEPVSGPTPEDYDSAIKQIVSNAITSNEVIDIFDAAGLDKQNVAILSDEFLNDIKNLKRKNVALELLKKLLDGKIKSISKFNVLMGKKFSEMLENTIKKYQERTIEAAEVIAELIKLAKEIRKETEKGDDLGLSNDEVAFYDALIDNESAVVELGDETLKKIAKELVILLRKNTNVDWYKRESIRAKIRIYIKKLLKKYNYPPDKQELATKNVLKQAEVVCKDWVQEKLI